VFVLGLFLRFCFHPSVENFYNLCREINFKLRAHFVEALSEAKTFREYKAVKECFARRSAFRAHTTLILEILAPFFLCNFFTGEIERFIKSPSLCLDVCRRICSSMSLRKLVQHLPQSLFQDILLSPSTRVLQEKHHRRTTNLIGSFAQSALTQPKMFCNTSR